MKFISKIFIVLFIISSFAKAGLVDAISVIINDEPITLYEIYKYSQKLKISKKEALQILIRQKLEDAQIKRFNITATDDEINNYIEKVATKNGMDIFKFYETLRTEGIDKNQYKKDIAVKIKRDKLYRRILLQKNIKPANDKAAREYYEKNRNEFVATDEFKTTVYESKNKKSLQEIKNNPMMMPKDVKTEKRVFKSGKFSQKLESILNRTKTNEFTPILNFGDKFVMFYINKKEGVKEFPYDKVKNYIIAKLNSLQEKAAIDSYFDKIKSNADIKILRKP